VPDAAAPVLAARELCTYYGRSQALFDVSLAAGREGGVAVLGRNGAGKTTLLRTLAGELQPRRGRIDLDGADATRLPTEQRVRRGLSYVPQEHAVFGRLSVRENLLVGAMASGDRRGIDEVLALFPKLAQRLDQAAGTLSGGERKMLAVGRALLTRPKVLLLDEPTEGVWIGVIHEIAERLRELARRISLVLVEQHLELALSVARHAYVLDRGRVVLEGPSEVVRGDPRLLRYLAP
jgi:branched-chain amino acid transport system ATP-binding protein